MANDIDPAAPDTVGGAGLAGIADRVATVGGTQVRRREGDRFEVVVRVPAARPSVEKEGRR